MLSHIVEAFVHVNAEETWKILLPSVTEAILNITESENIKSEQTLSSELMHHLGLLKDVCFILTLLYMNFIFLS